MKEHKLFNKAVAGMLTFALALGVVPAAIGGGIEAYADSAAPSVSAYADKTALTDDTFKPNDDGTATNIGMINFGGKAWYLLGGDGTNVDVFAAENFDTAAFQDITPEDLTPDTEAWNSVDYGSVTKPTTVYPNNYGASDLRVTLQDLATSETFNTVEKSMLPSDGIEVSTTDLKNSNATYTTKDKLYAASAGDGIFGSGSKTIDVNGKTLDIESTYNDGALFWLRSPSAYHYNIAALYATPGVDIRDHYVYYSTLGVRPATNLDFSSVLFASAVPAQAPDTAKAAIDSEVMNLRLEATEDTTVTKAALGEVSLDSTSGTITATKGTGSATLVVQGNDGVDDWYYTKALSDATTTVSASDIADGVDLANCKVWIEAKGSDGMTYATEPSTKDPVTGVTISITEPVVGNLPSTSPTIESTPANAVDPTDLIWLVTSEENYNPDSIPDSDWSLVDGNDKFEAGKYYLFVVRLITDATFSDDMKATCNGQDPVLKYFQESNSTALLYYAFHVTGNTHTHSYGPDVWNSDTSYHWHECTDANCPDKADSIKDKAKHTFKWVIDRKATTSKTGIKHKVCTVCGYTCNENTKIAKLDSENNSSDSNTDSDTDSNDNNIPAAGDSINIVVAFIILLAGAAIVCVVAYRRKKHTVK